MKDLIQKTIMLYKKTGSLNRTPKLTGVSLQKVRRILMTNGLYENKHYNDIKSLHDQGLSTKDIAVQLNLSTKYVNAHMPYEKGLYKTERPTLNAIKIRECRARKRGEDVPERKGKHLLWNDRLVIRNMLCSGASKEDIAMAIDCCRATVYNEIKRGADEKGEYDPKIADDAYREMLQTKGRVPKLVKDRELLIWLENKMVNEKYSPSAALMKINQEGIEFREKINSVNTIYKAINDGRFDGLQLCNLPQEGRRKKRRRRTKRDEKKPSPVKKKTIEERPDEAKDREVFGYWEMDTVVGKQTNRKNLLVFTERKTRFEIIEVLKYHTEDEVRKALDRIEKRLGNMFYLIFKSITVDNGAEFKDHVTMQKALYRKDQRTDIYYCHPNCPHERGGNECQNKLIRRWFPKGSDFDRTVTRNGAKAVEDWMNNYPRGVLGGLTPNICFQQELEAMGFP